MDKLYINIRNRRKELGWTQQDLADRMGYTNRATIAKIENGGVDISQSKIIQFAKVLQTTPSELMGEVDGHEASDKHPEFYDSEVVQSITEKLRTNPDYAVLFKAASDVKPEDIEFVTKFIEKMS